VWGVARGELVFASHVWSKDMNGDFCDSEGARKLKAKIEEYWAQRGFEVSISLVEAGFVPAMRSARTDVRSNMVNGMPPRRKSPAAGQRRAPPGLGRHEHRTDYARV